MSSSLAGPGQVVHGAGAPLGAAKPALGADRDREAAISVRGAGKCYEIYPRPIDRLKQTLWRGRRQFFREFWALRNVSFDVQRGEAFGIIGRNGSGKSTLLQIIAGTLRPTTGEVAVRGRVHALLELGSGFNFEFTGRENVFVNGVLLGLTRAEIEDRFDEIAAFAEIGDFIDQPVKTYSTGMVVRLAFAVQVLMQPDILIVDEALAVGDAAFQIKCINRMKRLIAAGVSVLLVTHDVATVRSVCDRALWLDSGELRACGGPLEVTSRYMQFLFNKEVPPELELAPEPSKRPTSTGDGTSDAALTDETSSPARTLIPLAARDNLVRWGSGEVRIEGFAIDNGTAGAPPLFEHGERLHVEVEIRAQQAIGGGGLGVGCAFRNAKGLDIITCTSWDAGVRFPALAAGESLRVAIELENILAPGEYALVFEVEHANGKERHYYDFVENALLVRVGSGRLVFSAVLPQVRYQVLDSSRECEKGSPTA